MARICFGQLWDVQVGYTDAARNKTRVRVNNTTFTMDADVARDAAEWEASVKPKLKAYYNKKLGWEYITKVKNKIPAAKYFYGRLLFGSFSSFFYFCFEYSFFFFNHLITVDLRI